MKLFQLALVSAVAVAQRNKNKAQNNYSGSRPQNPPQNYQQPAAQKPNKPKPVYGGNNQGNNRPNNNRPQQQGNYFGQGGQGGQNQAGNGASQFGGTGDAYGDPHFMVSSAGQDPICFDFNPPAGSEMTLIMDPESSLHVSAQVDGRRQGKTRFMTKITIGTPLGAILTIDENGAQVSGLPTWIDSAEPKKSDEKEVIEYGDIKYTELWSEDGSRDKITVEIDNGPSFLIKAKALRETISFGITSSRGLSPKTRGVIGQFVKADAYTVEKAEEDNFATVHIDDFSVDAVWDTFHRNTQCWTIEEQDLVPLFELL